MRNQTQQKSAAHNQCHYFTLWIKRLSCIKTHNVITDNCKKITLEYQPTTVRTSELKAVLEMTTTRLHTSWKTYILSKFCVQNELYFNQQRKWVQHAINFLPLFSFYHPIQSDPYGNQLHRGTGSNKTSFCAIWDEAACNQSISMHLSRDMSEEPV